MWLEDLSTLSSSKKKKYEGKKKQEQLNIFCRGEQLNIITKEKENWKCSNFQINSFYKIFLNRYTVCQQFVMQTSIPCPMPIQECLEFYYPSGTYFHDNMYTITSQYRRSR